MALVNTYVTIPPALLNILNTVSTICLLMAMVALGLNVAFKDLKIVHSNHLSLLLLLQYACLHLPLS